MWSGGRQLLIWMFFLKGDAVTIDTVQALVEKKADAELKARIEKASADLRAMFPSGKTFELSMGGQTRPVQMTPYSILKQLTEQLFTALQQENRHDAARDFVEQVERLQTEVNQLTESIH